MDAEKSLGESSNSNNNNNRSLLNNNSNSSTNHSPTTGASYKPSSSSNNVKKTPSSVDDLSDFDIGDESAWWECSLCTYRNLADKFKCEICDLRRGTSTRKPRCNADTIVAQVVKQQEQIRQQTRVSKTSKSRSSTSTTLNPSSSNSGSTKVRSRSSKSKNDTTEGQASDSEDELSDSDSSPPKVKKKRAPDAKVRSKKPKKSGQSNTRYTADSDDSTESDYSDTTNPMEVGSTSGGTSDSSSSSSSSSSTAPESNEARNHGLLPYSTAYAMSSDDEIGDATTRATIPTNYLASSETPGPGLNRKKTKKSAVSSLIPQSNTFDIPHPNKITPIKVSGNLIKYTPPTSSGRTGLIIDKNRFTQHSVTVNDVTVTFTEYTTRQSTYVRKKKKRRDGSTSKPKSSNGSSKSRPPNKNQPKPPSSNSASSTTQAEAP